MGENDGVTEEQRPPEAEPENGSDSYDVEVFRQLTDDVRSAHQHELDSYIGKKEMGWRIIQFNGVVGTIAVALLTQVDISPPLGLGFLITISFGGVLLVLSTILGMYVQRPDTMRIGPQEDWIGKIRRGGIPEIEYLAVYAYRLDKSRRDIVESTNRRTVESSVAMILSVCGLLLFLTGVVFLHVQ